MFFKKKKKQENTYQNREVNREITISNDEINVRNFNKEQIIEWINLTGKYVKNPNKYKMKNENDMQKFIEVSSNEILAFSLENKKDKVRDYYVRKDQFAKERI